jgi:hypothetical protein
VHLDGGVGEVAMSSPALRPEGEAVSFGGGGDITAIKVEAGATSTNPSIKWGPYLYANEAADVTSSLRGGLIGVSTLRGYSRPKDQPGLLNLEQWLMERPVPVHDVFMRGVDEEARAILFSGYLVAVKNGKAGSFEGKGKRAEQITAIIASIKFHFRVGYDLADGAPSMVFFGYQLVLDIIKGCARTDAEFRIHVEEKKAQAKLPWNWHLMDRLIEVNSRALDARPDGGWSTAADMDERCSGMGGSLLFDVGCRPGSVCSPDSPGDAHHTLLRDQAVAYRFEPSEETGAPVLQGYTMGPDIYWLAQKEILVWSIAAVFIWAAVFVKIDIQIITTKVVGGIATKAGDEGIAQPVTIAERSKREAWLKNNLIALTVIVPGRRDQDFFTRVHPPTIGDVRMYLEGPLPTEKTKGIRKMRAKDVTDCMRKAAASLHFDPLAFSAKSMRSGRQSDVYHRGVPENANLPLADTQRAGNWRAGSNTPGSFYTAMMHGKGEFALATDDIDWSMVGKEDTESMLVRREINQAVCAKRDAEGGAEAATSVPSKKRKGAPKPKADPRAIPAARVAARPEVGAKSARTRTLSVKAIAAAGAKK